MSFAILIQQILIIFLEIGTGYGATKLGILDEKNSKFLSNLVMFIFIPCTLLASSSIDGGREAVVNMLEAFVLLEILYLATAIVCMLLSNPLGLTHGQKAVLIGTAVMPNSAFVGIPLISALLGSDPGSIYGASSIMAYNIFFFTYVVQMFSPGQKFNIKSLITPANITTVAMVVMLLTDLRLPKLLQSYVTAMGNCTTPLALMIVGAMLARSSLRELIAKPFLWLTTTLRCLVFPLAFMAVLYFLPLSTTLRMSVLIFAACPAGSMAAVLAEQKGVEGELASQAVAHSTMFIIFSVPLVLSIGSRLFGI